MPAPRLDRYVVRSTDLNRRSGQILERAARYPVLIDRGDDPLVLARHEWVSGLVDSDARAELLNDLSGYLARRLTGQRSDEGERFDWLNAFSDAGVREFVNELRGTVRDIQAGTLSPEALEIVLHEWQESAIRPKEYLAALRRTAKRRA